MISASLITTFDNHGTDVAPMRKYLTVYIFEKLSINSWEVIDSWVRYTYHTRKLIDQNK